MNDTSQQRPVKLHAGGLSMLFDPRSAALRTLCWGDREVLRGIYSAVRDPNWGTAAPVLSQLHIEQSANAFKVAFSARCSQPPIDFTWDGVIIGQSDGTIRYEMDGRALSTFLRARIGFCILHPIGPCAGQPCVVRKTDGSIEHGTFPLEIAPDAPLMGMQSIAHEVLPGLTAEVRFEGEVFEMEDQRNWTDASYKTFCTPLALSYPVEVSAGTTVRQAVTLTLTGDATKSAPQKESEQPPIEIHWGPEISLPLLGLGMASHRQPLSDGDLSLLKTLKLDHLRVDLHLSAPECADELRRATREAQALGASLHAAIFLSDDAAGELKALRKLLEELRPRVSVWLVFPPTGLATPLEAFHRAREILGPYDSAAKFAAGTDADFYELNVNRPSPGVADWICFSVNPQTHADDEESIMQTLEAQPQTVESARQFAGGAPIALSAVTLKPRFNPYAIVAEAPPRPGELPRQVDLRQASLFAAAWTLGSIAQFARAGACSVTYYETTGWRGVIPSGVEPPPATDWPHEPGSVYPVYHVLADVRELAAGQLLALDVTQPQKLLGLASHGPKGTQVLLANLTDQPQVVRLLTWDDAPARCRVRALDSSTLAEATTAPRQFRTATGQPQVGPFVLRPYAVARFGDMAG